MNSYNIFQRRPLVLTQFIKTNHFEETVNRRFSYKTKQSQTTNSGKVENGIHHDFNKFNDLTGKEWLKFQKSWFVLNPKRRSKDVLLHPAKFPEELVESFVNFFTRSGDIVLDPMAGTGSTIISCINSNRSSIGIELSQNYSKIAGKRIESTIDEVEDKSGRASLETRFFCGDARDIDELGIDSIDYCITSPPYWDMLLSKGFETQEERKKMNLDTHYSDSSRDLGNMRVYEDFLDVLVDIYMKVHNVLKPGAFLTVIVKNIKKKGKIYPLAWDISRRLSNFFILKDEKIWCQDNIRLAPYGYGRTWVSNTFHHYCLNFRKDLMA